MSNIQDETQEFPAAFQLLKDEPYANFLGIKLVTMDKGSATAELLATENMLNSNGTVHGGVIFSLADFAFAAASNSYGQVAVGVNNSINYFAAGRANSLLRAHATEVKRTRKLAWYTVQVHDEDTLIASMEAMVYLKSQKFVKE